MWDKRGQTVDQFGLDRTHLIKYTFNQQGFRSTVDYTTSPQVALFGCSLVFGIGVEQSQITASLLDNCQNYGLAGHYSNFDIATTIENFINSDLYTEQVKMAVVWTHRNDIVLDKVYQRLKTFNIVHFFCGTCLNYNNCYKFIPSIDFDVSQTHMGVKSHKMFYKMLCGLFNQ